MTKKILIITLLTGLVVFTSQCTTVLRRTIVFTTTTTLSTPTTTLPPSLIGISPSCGKQSQTKNIEITGQNTNWSGDLSSSVHFSSSGITLNTAKGNGIGVIANISIASDAALGNRTVTIDNVSGSTTFSIVATTSAVVSDISPSSGEQGQTQDIVIYGENVSWSGNMSSSINFSGTGITINSAAGNGTTINANISIASDATAGARNVTVSGTEGSLNFTVTKAAENTQIMKGLSLGAGEKGQTLDLRIIGENVNWSGDMSSLLNFSGSGITINSATGNGNTIHANITIAPDASAGVRTITVDGTDYSLKFEVVGTNSPILTGISPTSGKRGVTSLDLQISGENVNWSGDVSSSIHFSGSGITLNSASGSGTTINANISIDGGATLGARTITVDGIDGNLSFAVAKTSAALKPDTIEVGPAYLKLEIPSAAGTGRLIITTPPPQMKTVAIIPITYEPEKTIFTASLINQINQELSGAHIITAEREGQVFWQKTILFQHH